MVVKSLDNLKYDTFREKARALILDENNKIILTEIEGSYVLPGGKVEKGEDLFVTIKRELAEEIGLIIDDIDYLITFTHYHEAYMEAIKKVKISRVNINHYYFKRIKSSDLKENNPTDFELEHHMHVKIMTYEEIMGKIEERQLKKDLGEEIVTILEYAKSQGLI